MQWLAPPIVLFCVLDHWELLQWDMDQQVLRVHLSKYFNGALVTLCRHFLCGRNVWLLLCWTFRQPLWQVWPATLLVILLTVTIRLMSPLLSLKAELHAHGQCDRLHFCCIYGLLQAGCFFWDAHHWTFHCGSLFWPLHWLCAHLCWGNISHIYSWSTRNSASAWSRGWDSHCTGEIQNILKPPFFSSLYVFGSKTHRNNLINRWHYIILTDSFLLAPCYIYICCLFIPLFPVYSFNVYICTILR